MFRCIFIGTGHTKKVIEMIKANELMMGNKVITKSGSILTVSTIQYVKKDDFTIIDFLENKIGHLITSSRDDNVHPIQITPGILLACGFTLCKTDECVKTGIVYQLYPLTAIQNSTGGFSFKYIDRWIKNLLPSYPEFLHQLQNLYFAITGEQLQVRL